MAKRIAPLRKPARSGVSETLRTAVARAPDRVAILRRRRSANAVVVALRRHYSTLSIVIGCALAAIVILHVRHNAMPSSPPVQRATARRLDSPTSVPKATASPPAFVGAGSAPSTAVPPLVLIHARLRQLLERQTGDDLTDDTITAELANTLTDDNAASIVQALSAAELHTDFGTLALIRWSTRDPRAVAGWISSARTPTDQQLWLIGKHLAAQSGQLDALGDALPDGSYRQSFLSGAALTLAETDPRRAALLASQMSPDETRRDTYETIANAWISTDPVAAQKWASGITEPALRERLLAVGAKSLAATDPDLAATWLASTVRSPSLLTESTLSIIDTWAERDPTAAATWVGSFPTQMSRVAAIEHVLDRWQKSDPASAAEWLSHLPESPEILARQAAAQAEAAEPKS